MTGVGLFQVRTHGCGRMQELSGEMTIDWIAAEQRPAKVNRTAGEDERSLLNVVRWWLHGNGVRCTGNAVQKIRHSAFGIRH